MDKYLHSVGLYAFPAASAAPEAPGRLNIAAVLGLRPMDDVQGVP